MNYEELVEKYKLHLSDVKFENVRNRFDVVQLKYDGFWVLLSLEGGQVKVISSGAEVRRVIEVDAVNDDDTLLVAEWLFGTSWSNKFKETNDTDFMVHDCVRYQGRDITDLPYSQRLEFAHKKVLNFRYDKMHWEIVGSYPIDNFLCLWNLADFEGVVFKNSDAPYGVPVGRQKHDFSMDYVFMGVNEGGGKYVGMAGSLIGGLYVDGVLKPVCNVGGLTDELRVHFWKNREMFKGTVFEAQGKALFKSGALRHPYYFRMRADKKAKDCVLK